MSFATSAPARAVERVVHEGVVAAYSADAERLAQATVRIGSQDPQRLAIVSAAVIRSLLERHYAGGLDGDDAKELLQDTIASGAWFDDLDATVLVTVLTGALGISDPAETPPTASLAMFAHACLLIAFLLDARSTEPRPDELSPAADRALTSLITAALAEIERAETIELP